ncbi:TonB-linked SusC/RagA family outer membrane protein [Dysgonomonas hofstadii]|uniref:TonB-linked SusC/RagA family outer membrane protein n=1 Tax=Dysgonomonas hofstadii TaxID=637886 RepID=A0A840CNW4_9BACT|nr:TonB-dependent receptor [Dysgonomonas hofstadii]MBB4034262.1 TonB-linked SusC/RagA family outer membrane protein [Dysgonomonas hofstadii]
MNFKKTLFLCWILCSCINIYGAHENQASGQGITAQEKKIRISGTIVDNEKNPLIGVSVKEKGNAVNGTITDIDGHFYMDVPNKQTIIEVSYIGFKPQEIEVGSNINFNIILQEDINSLEEVVVTGYGNQKKMSVIGSIETINPENLQVGSTRSVSNNLAGQIAGVIAVKRSGEPGYDNSNFWIRGIASFSGTQNPLILIDGIERDLNNIDPAEIESFSVLKDASASAMYGVRGANGVIVINTKRGKIGAPTVNIRVEQSISEPTKLPKFIGAADHMELLNLLKEDKSQLAYSQEQINRTRYGYDRDLYPDVNWLDEITKDYAYATRANLTVSGGSDFLRYSLVGAYFGEKGIMETDNTLPYDTGIKLNRYNMRANVDIDITKTTTLRMNIGGYLQQRRGQNSSTDDTFAAAFTTAPFVHPARYSDGTIPVVANRQNPWAMATQRGYYTTSTSQIQSLFALEQNLKMITQGLKAKVTFSFDSYSSGRMTRSMTPSYYNVATGRDIEGNLIHDVLSYGDESLGHSNEGGYGNNNVYFEANATYNRVFNKVHDIDALFLYNHQSYDDGSFQPYRKQGIAGRLSYMYDSRYIAEFNFGYNGSENFEKGKRFGFFPSAAIGWLMSEEPFLRDNFKNLTKLKLRGSIGKAGNDNIGGRRFAYMTTISTSENGYHWGDTSQNGRDKITEGEIGVTDLTWETALKYNAGFELGLWNELEFHMDLFKEKRKNIFMRRSVIPSQTGFINNPWANYGKVDNKGVEFSLTYNKRINKDWQVGFRSTFTYAKNTIEEYDEAQSVKGTHRSITGLSMNTLWGLQAERLFTADDFDENGNLKEGIPPHSVGNTTVRPGDIKYVDRNGDGLVTDEDEGYIGGTVDPRIVYGFGGNINYKNWDMSFFFQGVGDTHRIIGGSTYFMPGSGKAVLGNVYDNYNDRWTEENPSQDVFWPRLSEDPNQHNYRASTWWKKDMSFLRCKVIELGYSLPKSIVSKASLKSVRVYVSGNDLFYFSKFKMWDPELNTSDGLKYPGMRSVMFGIDINF